MADPTYSSTHMRERDKIIEEKHKKELAVLERRIERLKWANSDTLKQLFDAQTRGTRLAESLGFHDIHEAQVFIGTADYELPYKECFENFNKLQADYAAEKAQKEKLQTELELLQKENEVLRSSAADIQHHKEAASEYKARSEVLSQQVTDLQSRYDAIAEIKERAAARYRADYKRWRSMKNWIFSEAGAVNKDSAADEGLTQEERKRREVAGVMRKRKIILELGLDPNLFEVETGDDQQPLNRPLNSITNSKVDKENEATPMPERKKRRITEPPLNSSQSPFSVTSTLVPESSATMCLNITPSLKPSSPRAVAPLSSPSIFSEKNARNSRNPLTFQPIPNFTPSAKLDSSPLNRVHQAARPVLDVSGSSDTEDDSQAIGLFPAPTVGFKIPEPPATIRRRLPAMQDSSETEDESQNQAPNPTPTPLLPRSILIQKLPVLSTPKPAVPLFDSRRRSDVGIASHDVHRAKTRRMSENEPPRPNDAYDWTGGHTPTVPKTQHSGKGKEKEIFSTPDNATGQKRLVDYSAFKGRGRYAKDVKSVDESVGITYTIDPSKNGGLDYKYDEVVRRKDDRRKMDAGDCECCRDYYEAVGPLPSRLQPPLWRSPPNTPVKPCERHQQNHDLRISSSGSRQSEINSHKKAISRHRHQWERPKTPPGYWNIGFPDTQEAANINEQAQEMHRKKQAEIEDAVRKGEGRYQRR